MVSEVETLENYDRYLLQSTANTQEEALGEKDLIEFTRQTGHHERKSEDEGSRN
jgi:hypothetical protein